MTRYYRTGDEIIKEGATIQTRRYVVADPAYTTRGKLRLVTERGAIRTTWWGSGINPSWLPPHHHAVRHF